ncbi:hypothetical protein [Nonomuraea sp. NPDC003727]
MPASRLPAVRAAVYGSLDNAAERLAEVLRARGRARPGPVSPPGPTGSASTSARWSSGTSMGARPLLYYVKESLTVLAGQGGRGEPAG